MVRPAWNAFADDSGSQSSEVSRASAEPASSRRQSLEPCLSGGPDRLSEAVVAHDKGNPYKTGRQTLFLGREIRMVWRHDPRQASGTTLLVCGAGGITRHGHTPRRRHRPGQPNKQ
ncbi:hypothetical protein Pth03_43820 [Planotetraspora thailandica]|uniref:Uncharacterized protein n=1 Tax=Planotetraspora thailandica TaxID=487172 RepID=A0A8J3V203_9ACTN|nr:hypothetical protein Pth03_43820 [Planotetraspora thailandica]